MRLLIMRHGEAESAFSLDRSDAERRLTERGHLQARQAGRVLAEAGFAPSQLWASPYQRTQQTAADVIASFPGLQAKTNEALVPDNRPAGVLDQLAEYNTDSLMLVSHQPLVSLLVAKLTGQDQYRVPSMAPASMVLLEAEHLLPGCCEIVWHRHAPDFAALQ